MIRRAEKARPSAPDVTRTNPVVPFRQGMVMRDRRCLSQQSLCSVEAVPPRAGCRCPAGGAAHFSGSLDQFPAPTIFLRFPFGHRRYR